MDIVFVVVLQKSCVYHWHTFYKLFGTILKKKSESYLETSTYKSKDDLLKALGEYLFAKRYGQEVVDFVVFALSEIYKLRVYIFIDALDSLPNDSIGEDFQKSIYLMKRKDHYDLVKKIVETEQNDPNIDANGNL